MFKNFLLFSLTFAAVSLAQAPAATPQLKAPTGPRLILLDVMVTNDKGPVRDLTKDDFVLEDKGKKQSIALFDITEAGKLTSGTPLPPGVATNRLNSKGEVQGTATVVLYDRINSAAGDQAFVRAQVLRLLAGLKETDRIGFYSLGFGLQIVRDYNEDAGPLVRAAKALQQSTTVPESFSPEDKAVFKELSEAVSPMQQLQNQARVNFTYPAFRSIGRHLSGVLGRKNLLWVASVFPLTYANSVERRKNDQDELDAFRNNLTEANIALYPVDPGGTGASFNQSEGAPVSNEGSLMPGALRNQAGTSSINNVPTSLTGNQAMQILAEATGGKAFRNANDITPALREVTSAAEYTYTLGFYPDAKTLDGRTHDLKVTLVKKPATDKAKVSHRKQYFAWAPDSPAGTQIRTTLAELMEEPLLSSGVGLLGVVNPDPTKPGMQMIDLRVSAADLRFDQRGDKWAAAFEIAISVEGQKGASVKSYTPQFEAEQMQGVLVNGFDIRESLQTGDASGVFRVSLLDKSSGASGSIRLPFKGAK